MMNNIFFSAAKTVSALLFIGILAISCSNPASNDDDYEHEDAAGIRLKMNGAVIVEQLPGEDLTGEFELTPGEETDLVTVFFLAEDGDEFQPDEEEYSLGYEFDNDGIVEFEQHEEDGKWGFHLHAESIGVTDMRLMLMHSGHSDFTSRDIHVHVEAEE